MATLMGVEVRRYHSLYYRVEYPRERGYRIEPRHLPDWIYVTVTEDGESKWLTVHSSLHLNKEVKVGPSYSRSFTDASIIKDLTSEIHTIFIG